MPSADPPHPLLFLALPAPACPPARPQVEFTAAKTICDVRVDTVVEAASGQPVKYGSRTQLVTEGYHVE